MKFFSDIRLLLTAIWLGAAVFFIFVAQSAFAVLPERELAGAMVNRTLAIVNYSGLVIALILLATSLVGQASVNRFWLWTERIVLLVLAVATAIGQFVIGWWLMLLRNEMGKPIEQALGANALLQSRPLCGQGGVLGGLIHGWAGIALHSPQFERRA